MLSLLSALAFTTLLAQAISLWDPTGPYHVAYTQHVFNHTTPNDPTKPGNIVLLTIYYPTLQVPNDTVPYIDPISDNIYGGTLGFPNGSLSALTTNLQFQGPTLLGTSPEFGNGTSPYPTIIFLPGAGLPTLTYTAFQSELASYGYCVIGIDHPGEAPFVQLPFGGDGIYGYPDFFSYPPTPEEAFAVYNFRITDVLAVMSDPFLPSLIHTYGAPFNTTHFGVFGHSIGGSGAAGIMAANDTAAALFKAGGNIDGTLFQLLNETLFPDPTIVPADLERPFLELASEVHFNGSERAAFDQTWTYFEEGQTGWWRSLQVNRTRHLDFSDISLWVDRLGQRNGTPGTYVGSSDGGRTTEIYSSVVRKFIGYIEGKENALEETEEFYEGIPEQWWEHDGSGTRRARRVNRDEDYVLHVVHNMTSRLFPTVATADETFEAFDSAHLLRLRPLYSSFFVPPLLDKPQDPIIDTLKRSTGYDNTRGDNEPVPFKESSHKLYPLKLVVQDDFKKVVLDDALDMWDAAVKRGNAAQSQIRSWDGLQTSYSVPSSSTGFLSEQDGVMFAAARHHLDPQIQSEDTEVLYIFKDDLLRSLKMTMLGASTSLHEWDTTSETFMDRKSQDGRSRTIILFGKDKVISDETSGTGPTLHAFAHALSTCLASLRDLLDNCPPAEYGTATDDDLCAILAEYEPHREVLLALLSLCRRELNSSPSAYTALPDTAQTFLSHLFSALDAHLERKSPRIMNAIFAFLLAETSKHYMEAVCQSVGYYPAGQPGGGDSDQEELRHFPGFFSSELVSALPTARRSLKLLRAARPDHPILVEQQRTPIDWVWSKTAIEAAFSDRLPTTVSQSLVDSETDEEPTPRVSYKPELMQFRTFDLQPGSGIGHSCFDRNHTNVAEVRLRAFIQDFPETLPAIAPTLTHLATLILKPLLSHSSTLSSTLLSIFLTLPPPLNLQAHLKLMQSYMLLTSPSFKSRLSAAIFSDSLDFTVSGKDRQLFSLGSHRRAYRRSEVMQDKVWAVGLAPALLERDIWPPNDADLSFFLRTVIYDSFDATGEDSRQQAVEEVENRLGFAIRGSEGKDEWSNPSVVEALDFLYMEYKPPSPLDVVITGDIIFKYQRLYALLLRVLRVEAAIAAVFRMSRPSAAPLFPTLAQPRKLLLHFRFISQQFVGCISEYIYDTAIGGNFGPFLNKLHYRDKMPFPDVFSLAEAHSDVMDNILTACLTRTSQRIAGALLRDCLNTILQFAIIVGELHRGRMKEYEAAPAVEDLFNKLRKKVASLIKALGTMVDKRTDSSALIDGTRGGSHAHGPVGGTEALSHLLTRLDFGEWWFKFS
ncbi:hypothetical protein V5O48_005676 [Marasmius crinis-equi]|uniref:Gamma tubulin complex component C-terminal domain-containing protein n=1 Tax=Marasmius crinis-equi TaxID=585013 RepID=A0ABR3FM11_9AGAR